METIETLQAEIVWILQHEYNLPWKEFSAKIDKLNAKIRKVQKRSK